MPSPSQIVRAALVMKGAVWLPSLSVPFVQSPGDGTLPCYTSALGDDVDEAVRIHDVPGRVFGRQMNANKWSIHPGLTFLVRSLSDDWGVAQQLANVVDELVLCSVEFEGVVHYIQSVYRTSTIADVGEQVGKKRSQWLWHARVAFQDSEPQRG
jgi:hypothetical protein